MLLQVTGVDFTDDCYQTPFSYVFEHCTEIPEFKSFLGLLLSKISPQTPIEVIAHVLIDLSDIGNIDLIPGLLGIFFQRCGNDLTGVEVALINSILAKQDEVAACLIEQLDHFIPKYHNPINLHAAVEAGNLFAIEHLVSHNHNSYAIEDYGIQHAKTLEAFLKEAEASNLYHRIIRV